MPTGWNNNAQIDWFVFGALLRKYINMDSQWYLDLLLLLWLMWSSCSSVGQNTWKVYDFIYSLNTSSTEHEVNKHIHIYGYFRWKGHKSITGVLGLVSCIPSFQLQKGVQCQRYPSNFMTNCTLKGIFCIRQLSKNEANYWQISWGYRAIMDLV
jgi:hypothetical protein